MSRSSRSTWKAFLQRHKEVTLGWKKLSRDGRSYTGIEGVMLGLKKLSWDGRSYAGMEEVTLGWKKLR